MVAILSVLNEADILGQVLRHLAAQGVGTYIIDDGSTDESYAIAQSFLGRGVIGFEQRRTNGLAGEMDWVAILRRKEALAVEIDADWFMHHDADELREAPWPDATLVQAIQAVDNAGYNAIEFAVLDFWPVSEPPVPLPDVRTAFTHYEHSPVWNRVQVKCWKRTDAPVDLATYGGHCALFPGRRVFPVRFPLRHYPVRGTAHGYRKVFVERLARYKREERTRGWHIHYDRLAQDPTFVRDASTLTRFDPERVRLDLAIQDLATQVARQGYDADAADDGPSELDAARDRVTEMMCDSVTAALAVGSAQT